MFFLPRERNTVPVKGLVCSGHIDKGVWYIDWTHSVDTAELSETQTMELLHIMPVTACPNMHNLRFSQMKSRTPFSSLITSSRLIQRQTKTMRC